MALSLHRLRFVPRAFFGAVSHAGLVFTWFAGCSGVAATIFASFGPGNPHLGRLIAAAQADVSLRLARWCRSGLVAPAAG
jgi:hypothetical protein